jgi:tRNA 2-thiouridine synthesizing protein A
MQMIEIDVRGLSCPIPVVKTKQAMEKHPGQTILVLLESQVSKENVIRLAQNQGYNSQVEQKQQEYRLILEPKPK